MTPWEEWSAMLFGQYPTYDMSSAVLLGVHRPDSMSVSLPLEEAVADAAKDAEEHFREKITWAREHTPSAALDYVPIRMIPPGLPDHARAKLEKEFATIWGKRASQPFMLATIARFADPTDAVLFKTVWG